MSVRSETLADFSEPHSPVISTHRVFRRCFFEQPAHLGGVTASLRQRLWVATMLSRCPADEDRIFALAGDLNQLIEYSRLPAMNTPYMPYVQ